MKYIAFLRAINVGGHNVKMEQLRLLFESLRFTDVETFIASGNVIFDGGRRDTKRMEKQIEAHLAESLGYEVATFLRTPAQVGAIAEYQPFRDMEGRGLYVGFTRDPLSGPQSKTLTSFRTDTDDFHANGREVYWSISGGFSDSKFSNAVLEKKLSTRATFRNITTVRKLAAKYA